MKRPSNPVGEGFACLSLASRQTRYAAEDQRNKHLWPKHLARTEIEIARYKREARENIASARWRPAPKLP